MSKDKTRRNVRKFGTKYLSKGVVVGVWEALTPRRLRAARGAESLKGEGDKSTGRRASAPPNKPNFPRARARLGIPKVFQNRKNSA